MHLVTMLARLNFTAGTSSGLVLADGQRGVAKHAIYCKPFSPIMEVVFEKCEKFFSQPAQPPERREQEPDHPGRPGGQQDCADDCPHFSPFATSTMFSFSSDHGA